jgi:hypothetical protein
MTKRELPLTKRYPRAHVARFKVWLRDDDGERVAYSVGFEGRVSKSLAEFMIAACVHVLTPEHREMLDAMTKQLQQREPRNIPREK